MLEYSQNQGNVCKNIYDDRKKEEEWHEQVVV